jgi:hypothetical protein
VIRCEPTQQPHDLDVASSFSFKPPARLHLVQITVDVQLEENRGMVRWPASCLGIDPAEPKLGQIEAVDEDVDDANWIVLADPVFHAFRKQRALPTIHTINEALHPSPRKSCGNHIARITSSAAFSHSQGQKEKSRAELHLVFDTRLTDD